MAVNIQITVTEGSVAVIYFQDGSSMTVDENSSDSIQLIERGFATVSDAEPVESGEHPPPEIPFIELMIKFWQTLASQIKGEAPTATPVESKSSPQRRDYKKKEGDDGYGDEPP
jgi:hypothetical protein